MKNYTNTLIIVALALGIAVGVAWGITRVHAGAAHTASAFDHTCVAPCVVKFAPHTQEDEVAWDYRAGGTVAVTRACDHYCFEALSQSGRNLCKDFIILPVPIDKGDRWSKQCK